MAAKPQNCGKLLQGSCLLQEAAQRKRGNNNPIAKKQLLHDDRLSALQIRLKKSLQIRILSHTVMLLNYSVVTVQKFTPPHQCTRRRGICFILKTVDSDPQHDRFISHNPFFFLLIGPKSGPPNNENIKSSFLPRKRKRISLEESGTVKCWMNGMSG